MCLHGNRQRASVLHLPLKSMDLGSTQNDFRYQTQAYSSSDPRQDEKRFETDSNLVLKIADLRDQSALQIQGLVSL